MSRRIGRSTRAVEIQRANLPTFVVDGHLNDSESQDVPTAYEDQYNDVSNSSSSFSLLNNQNNPSQTFASTFEQNFAIHGVFNSHFELGTTSNQISVPAFPADRANVCNLLVVDAQTDHSGVNPLITGQANYQKKRKMIYIVEFQKRGLPHCHILLWVNKHYKCHSPYDVDSIISAEIPDKDSDQVGHEAVSQYMIHGPCGLANRFSPCMKENKCSKKFPKAFASETSFSDDGFVAYKRRDIENLFVLKNGIKLDNAFVVPYNRELLLNYQAHINVESCSQSTVIKYLFKYITKGVDRARAVFEDEEFNEVVAYLNCRYLAVWRLLQFHIHFREPSVERLSVHLPSDQNVIFRETDDLNYVINNPNLERTMLTQWFETNVQDFDARKLSYVEFPTKYVWKNDKKQWSRRKQGRSVGRVAYVHPSAGELYYLRLLLNYQKGSFSFDHLKTVKDVLEPTFQDACASLGLLGDDREWNSAMLEAVITASSFQLRQLFVTLVLFCNVANPSALFEAHWKTMCDDISRNMLNAFGLQDVSKYQDELRNSLLYELEKLFV